MKKISVVLFDLDGTLLPMDMDTFVGAYFGGLAMRLAPRGYEPKRLIDAIWRGTAAMVSNSGAKYNEEVFWDTFCGIFGVEAEADLPHFEAFYREDFDHVKEVCGYDVAAAQTVREIRARGYRVALATNPIFPAIATEKRMAWAGLSPADFELYTTYENARFCKPNPEYYRALAQTLGVAPEQCLMVGNDVEEDMVAAQAVGMSVFLLPACLINKKERDLSSYPSGNLTDLLGYLDQVSKT